jgi:hypothetical protein
MTRRSAQLDHSGNATLQALANARHLPTLSRAGLFGD